MSEVPNVKMPDQISLDRFIWKENTLVAEKYLYIDVHDNLQLRSLNLSI